MEISNKFSIQLEEIHLTNFRGFEELSLHLHPQLTVLIGRNGAGKTTVLDGIASLLQFPIDKILRQPTTNKSELLSEKDIRNGTREAVNTVTVAFEKDIGKGKKEVESTILSWYASLSKQGFDVDTVTEEQAFTEFETISEAIKIQLKKEEPTSLPIIVYYRCDYATDAPSFSNGETTSTEAYNAYDYSLSSRSFDLGQFAKWYKWREDHARDARNGKDRLREVTELAVCAMLSDEQSKYSTLKTKALSSGIGYELTILKNNELISVNQFSSGEKMLFALVADIARRLALANPKISKPLEGSGIVLIDEIDLHLHPGKQAEVLPKLLKIFPNIQFIVTTHSPHVLQNVERESVSILDNGKLLDYHPNVQGRDVQSVLLSAFSVEKYASGQKELLDKARRCYDLIDENELEEAEKLIQDLTKIWGETDQTIVELNTLLNLATP